MQSWKSIKTEYYLIGGIILLGTILRFWDFTNIPFTHDEFSALKRLHFDSFGELIEKGVKIDAHPAGIHVMMYYWIKLFGATEIVVKLPFILMGIASIWLIYKIGKHWFNVSAGLVSAAFMATMQFSIMYSQIARPYISGLFVCLLMVWYWSQLIKNPEEKYWKNYVGFILAAALCAYNHHFSLLFAALVGLTGIFVIQRKYLLKYALAGIAIFILYLPHLSIFLYQLNIGGVEEWLAKPTSAFLWEFILYLFHFSWFVYLIVIALVGFGIYHMKKQRPHKFFYISIIWFMVPFLIGYLYSVYVNSVLQYSVLIFSFPFFLLAIFGLLPKLESKHLIFVVGIISIINVGALVFERQHYKIFYQTRFKQFLVDTQKQIDELGEENCTVLLANHSEINDYYVDQLGLTFEYFNVIEDGKKVTASDLFKVIDYVENAQTKYLLFGGVAYAQSEIYPIIKEYYPTLENQFNYYASNLFVFKNNEATTNEYLQEFSNGFELSAEFWNYNLSMVTDSNSYGGNSSYVMTPDHEYGVEFEKEFLANEIGANDHIDFTTKVFFEDRVNETLLVTTIAQNDSVVHWSAGNTTNFNIQPNKWQTIYHSIGVRGIDYSQPFTLKSFVWNKEKVLFYLDDFTIRIRKGNPLLYSLTERIL